MAGFDPDAYLADKSKGFDPDAYLAKKAPAKPQADAAPSKPPDAGIDVGDMPFVGAADTLLSMGRSAVAKPIADIAGLAAQGYDYATGAHEGNAEGFKNELQGKIAGQPYTKQGRQAMEGLSLPGKGVDYAGKVLEQVIGGGEDASTTRRAIGAGVHEAVNQAPQLLGAKGPAIGEAAGRALKGEAGGGAAPWTARGMMQSAIKPIATALESGKAGKAIDTMLDRGYNVDKGGMFGKGAKDMTAKVRTLNQTASDLIDKSLPSMVNKKEVLKSLDPVFDKYERQIATTDDLASLAKIHEEFVNHPLLTGDQIPIKLANEIKQGTYRSIGDKAYGPKADPTATVDAQKAMARNLREQIEKRVPKVAPLNAEASELINALSVSERRVMMEANKNPLGLGVLTTSPKSFSAWMADRSGLFKSLVARMLNQGSKAAPTVGKLAPLGGVATTTGAGMIPPPPQQAASSPQ